MLKSNTVNKIIAAVVAVALWAYVITVENPIISQVVRDVTVQFTNMDMLASRNLTVASDALYTIDISVEGKRADLVKLTREDFTATVDLRGWQKGEQSIPVEVTGPEQVTILEKRPSKLTLNIEDLINVSKPIRIEYTEAFPDGTEPGFLTMVPDEIEVIGAKSQVDEISYVRVQIDSNMLSETSATFITEAVAINTLDEPIDSLRLSQQEIEVNVMLCTVREVPLRVNVVGEVDPMYEVTDLNIPRTVKIKGAKSDVNQIAAVTAQDLDISGVDVTSKIPLQLNLPQNVELADASAGLSVSIGIKGLATKDFQFTSNEIAIEGTLSGYSAHINTGVVDVTVYGSDDVIAGLEKDALELYVDLSQVEEGIEGIDLPILIRDSEAFKRVDLEPGEVYLNIYEAEVIDPETTGQDQDQDSDAGP